MLTKTLNLLFPPRCYACMHVIDDHGTLCTTCSDKIDWIPPKQPLCECCGIPLYMNEEEKTYCIDCLTNPPPYHQLRSVFTYNDASKMLILRYKYYDHTQASYYLGSLLISAGKEMLINTDIIVPVPLHWRRLFKRMYNQSSLLGLAVSKQTNTPFVPALKRHKYGKMQASLPRHKRLSQVKTSFSINKRYAEDVIGKHILLVDDVMTTGATINACVKTLLKGGANCVSVLTLARRF